MLDWKEYIEDIQELISHIHSAGDLSEFVENLKDGLEDDDIILKDEEEGKVVYYHNVPLSSKEDIKRFFSIQRRISPVHNSMLVALLKDTSYRTEFAARVGYYLKDADAVHVFRNVIVINNKCYHTRAEIIEDFQEVFDMDTIQEMCNQYEIALDGCGIVCDGIALITTNKEYLKTSARKIYPIEGYITKRGKLEWYHVAESAYMTQAVKGSDLKIRMLKGFQDTSYTVYRAITVFDTGIVQKPYPIAILEDGSYAFYYKKRAPKISRG